MTAAMRAAADAVPLGALEAAMATGLHRPAEAELDAAIAALEAALTGDTGLRAAGLRTAKGGTGLPGVIAAALEAGAAAGPLCVEAPSKEEMVDALQNYAAGGDVNMVLRGGGTPDKAMSEMIRGLDAQMKPTTEFVKVYRVADREFFRNLDVDDRITDLGYVSTSKRLTAITDTMLEDLGVDRSQMTLFEISIPKGAGRAVDVNATLPKARNYFAEQHELLLARGQSFEVDAIFERDGFQVVSMRLVK